VPSRLLLAIDRLRSIEVKARDAGGRDASRRTARRPPGLGNVVGVASSPVLLHLLLCTGVKLGLTVMREEVAGDSR
jgi:hypothetical protein